jgi:hypothetical protein
VGAPLTAQTAEDLPRLGLSVAAGLARPTDATFRELYGNAAPLTLQVDYRVARRISAFGGLRYLRTDGLTIMEVTTPGTGVVIEERFALAFRSYWLRAGLQLSMPAGRLRVNGGAGIGYVRYREEWKDADLTASGGYLGGLLYGGVDYPVAGRLSLLGRLEYSSVTAGGALGDVNLGGIDLLAGVKIEWK